MYKHDEAKRMKRDGLARDAKFTSAKFTSAKFTSAQLTSAMSTVVMLGLLLVGVPAADAAGADHSGSDYREGIVTTETVVRTDALLMRGAEQRTTFLQSEGAVLGRPVSSDWRRLNLPLGVQSDDGIGGVSRENEMSTGGSSNTGQKVLAGFMSALIPGTGQFYNRQSTKGFIMLGIDVAIWGTYFLLDEQSDRRVQDYQEYAGVYAGTSGDHAEGYWQALGRYLDSDAYNEALLREARALAESPSGLVDGSSEWQWRNETFQDNYQQLRADATNAEENRDFMIFFAVVNRAVSVVDAVRNGGHRNDSTLGMRVLGLDVALDATPSLSNPRARCVLSRRF